MTATRLAALFCAASVFACDYGFDKQSEINKLRVLALVLGLSGVFVMMSGQPIEANWQKLPGVVRARMDDDATSGDRSLAQVFDLVVADAFDAREVAPPDASLAHVEKFRCGHDEPTG